MERHTIYLYTLSPKDKDVIQPYIDSLLESKYINARASVDRKYKNHHLDISTTDGIVPIELVYELERGQELPNCSTHLILRSIGFETIRDEYDIMVIIPDENHSHTLRSGKMFIDSIAEPDSHINTLRYLVRKLSGKKDTDIIEFKKSISMVDIAKAIDDKTSYTKDELYAILDTLYK